MLRRTFIVASLLFTTAAFSQSMGERTGVNSTLGIAPTTPDFVSQVAMSDMLEIESSKLALQRGNAQKKTFAQQMIEGHTKTSTELKAIVSKAGAKMSLPTALDSTHQSKLDNLKSSKPETFVSDYSSLQVSAHKDAVSLFERYADKGDNADLKAWANKTLPDLKHHLMMAEKLPTK